MIKSLILKIITLCGILILSLNQAIVTYCDDDIVISESDEDPNPVPDSADEDPNPVPDSADEDPNPVPDSADEDLNLFPDSADEDPNPIPDSADEDSNPVTDYADEDRNPVTGSTDENLNLVKDSTDEDPELAHGADLDLVQNQNENINSKKNSNNVQKNGLDEENELENEKENTIDNNDISLSDFDILQSIKNIILNEEKDGDINISLAEEKNVNRSVFNLSKVKNVVEFQGSFNNYDCSLIIPFELYKNLDVIDSKLINVGSSSVTGRILYEGDDIDTTEYEYYTYILNPIYNNPNSVYQYGNLNYRRHYYESSGNIQRLVYDDMYGNFYVEDIKLHFAFEQRLYYLGLVLLLSGGVIWLWIRRH